jgi:hypothetical protein
MDIDYPKWEFEFQQRNRQPALFADMWLRALRPVFREELGLPVVENIDYIFTADAKGWVAKEHKKEILALIRLHSNDVGFLDSIVKKMDIRLRDLKNIQEKIVQSYQHASNEELAALWKEFDKLFVRFIPGFGSLGMLPRKILLSRRSKHFLSLIGKRLKKLRILIMHLCCSFFL